MSRNVMIKILWKISFESNNRGLCNLVLDNWDKIRMIAYKTQGEQKISYELLCGVQFVRKPAMSRTELV